jgi:DNA mismatch repair protein MutS2
MEFFLQGTREAIGFDKVLALISPVSCYGKEYKESLPPYLPGEEKSLEKELAQVRASSIKLAQCDPVDRLKIKNLLAVFPNIKEEINLVKNGLVLHEINLFNIKKFLYLVDALSRLFQSTQLVPETHGAALLPPGELQQKFLHKNTGYQFYLGDYGGEDYLRVQQEIKELSALLAKAEKNGMQRIKDEFSFGDENYTGKYIYIAKNDPERLKQALDSPLLEKHQDFDTEICFARKVTDCEKELAESIAMKNQEKEVLELQIRKELTKLIEKYADYLEKAQQELGYLDWLLAKADFMTRFDCVVPKIEPGTAIRLIQGININIKSDLEKQHKVFAPVTLNFDSQIIVITGANMGGKTVTLKTLGLLVAMAQYGIPVPAQEFVFPLFQFLFLTGEKKEKTGLSSFAEEIEQMKMLLSRINEQGLVLLDEPARSTNPQEGSAIVGALLKRMAKGKPVSIAVTHFEGLARMVGAEHWQVRGVKSIENLFFKEEDLEKYFDYSLEKVEIDKQVPRDAIKVAELLGLEKEVLLEAKNLYQKIVKGGPK